MVALRVILTVVFIIVCLAIIVLVLMQEGKSSGLGALSGAAESYWGKNKARTMQGMLVKLTKIFCVLFMVLAIVLNMNIF